MATESRPALATMLLVVAVISFQLLYLLDAEATHIPGGGEGLHVEGAGSEDRRYEGKAENYGETLFQHPANLPENEAPALHQRWKKGDGEERDNLRKFPSQEEDDDDDETVQEPLALPITKLQDDGQGKGRGVGSDKGHYILPDNNNNDEEETAGEGDGISGENHGVSTWDFGGLPDTSSTPPPKSFPKQRYYSPPKGTVQGPMRIDNSKLNYHHQHHHHHHYQHHEQGKGMKMTSKNYQKAHHHNHHPQHHQHHHHLHHQAQPHYEEDKAVSKSSTVTSELEEMGPALDLQSNLFGHNEAIDPSRDFLAREDNPLESLVEEHLASSTFFNDVETSLPPGPTGESDKSQVQRPGEPESKFEREKWKVKEEMRKKPDAKEDADLFENYYGGLGSNFGHWSHTDLPSSHAVSTSGLGEEKKVCYRTEDILVIIAITCCLNFAFVLVVWGCVRWLSAGSKRQSHFQQLDCEGEEGEEIEGMLEEEEEEVPEWSCGYEEDVKRHSLECLHHHMLKHHLHHHHLHPCAFHSNTSSSRTGSPNGKNPGRLSLLEGHNNNNNNKNNSSHILFPSSTSLFKNCEDLLLGRDGGDNDGDNNKKPSERYHFSRQRMYQRNLREFGMGFTQLKDQSKDIFWAKDELEKAGGGGGEGKQPVSLFNGSQQSLLSNGQKGGSSLSVDDLRLIGA